MKNVTIENCLATGFPEITAEWHPDKNGNSTPYDMVAGSRKKCWFLCKKGHEWAVRLGSRTTNGTGCPYCTGQKVCVENCLATKFPEIAAEWHPTKNGNMTPYDVLASGIRKVWWKCKKCGYEWKAGLSKRTSNKTGCPNCIGHILRIDNCLATRFPEIAAEWHPTKNSSLIPYDVFAGSRRKVWWLCKKGHEWQSPIRSRTGFRSKGCPFCGGRKVCLDNCLATLYPELCKEWDFMKNGNLTPYDVVAGCEKKVWWKCDKGHEWRAKVCLRVQGTGCPICKESKGEKNVAKIFVQLNLRFKRQWKFKSCRSKLPLPFDFVVKTKNGIKIVEYQGKQHFEPIAVFGGEKNFIKIQKSDSIKRNWCHERKVPFLEIPYWEKDILGLLKEFMA